MDANFSDDIQQVRDHPGRPVDPVDFSDIEKQRNMFFLQLGQFFAETTCLACGEAGIWMQWIEAYRSLIQQNEPISKDRSMGLLHVIMNSHAFSGKLFSDAACFST